MHICDMTAVLHEDILRLIFAHFSTDDRRDTLTLLSLAQVCRQFYALITPLVYRSLHLVTGFESRKRNLETLMTRFVTNTKVIEHIREIHIAAGNWDSSQATLVESLTKLIPRLTRLDAFSWPNDGNSMLPIMQLVCQHWPACRLRPHYTNIADPEMYSLIDMIPQNLCELHLCIPKNPASRHKAEEKLAQALRSCSNLEKLHINQEPQGCVVYSLWTGPQARLAFSKEDAIPRPVELSFEERPFPWEDIQSWADLNGFKRLRKLSVYDPGVLSFFPGCEAMLRSLSIKTNSTIDERALEEFCSRLRCLKELSVVGRRTRIPFQILRKYGSRLEKLDIHGRNMDDTSSNSEVMSDTAEESQFHDIDRWCPNLTHLELNMVRNDGNWPYAFLSTIARFSKLTSLVLYVQSIYFSPKLIQDAGERSFEYLSSRKVGTRLRSLIIHQVSNEEYGGWNQDHAVFRRTLDPFTGERTVTLKVEGGESEYSREFRECTDRHNRDKHTKDVEAYQARPPSVFRMEIEAYNAFWQSLAPNQPEFQIAYQDYEIRTRNHPARLSQYEKEWEEKRVEDDILLVPETITHPIIREQMQRLLESQDEDAKERLHSFGKGLREELQRRVNEGWDLWDMEGFKPKAGSEGFLFEKFFARER